MAALGQPVEPLAQGQGGSTHPGHKKAKGVTETSGDLQPWVEARTALLLLQNLRALVQDYTPAPKPFPSPPRALAWAALPSTSLGKKTQL